MHAACTAAKCRRLPFDSDQFWMGHSSTHVHLTPGRLLVQHVEGQQLPHPSGLTLPLLLPCFDLPPAFQACCGRNVALRWPPQGTTVLERILPAGTLSQYSSGQQSDQLPSDVCLHMCVIVMRCGFQPGGCRQAGGGRACRAVDQGAWQPLLSRLSRKASG